MQLLPHVAHGWLIQEVTPDAIATAAACGFEMVCPRANALTAAGVQQLVAHGFAVRAWGVKTIEVREREREWLVGGQRALLEGLRQA
jgi:hypothetical protein